MDRSLTLLEILIQARHVVPHSPRAILRSLITSPAFLLSFRHEKPASPPRPCRRPRSLRRARLHRFSRPGAGLGQNPPRQIAAPSGVGQSHLRHAHRPRLRRLPEVRRKAPVVLLIHEIFGLTDWAKEMADELAARASSSSRPTCSSGVGPNGGGSSAFPRSGRRPSKPSPASIPARVTADLNAAADYGKKFPAANGKTRRHRLLLGRRQVLPLRHRIAKTSPPPSSSTAPAARRRH